MFCCHVDDATELRLIDRQHGEVLLRLLDANRDHLRRWHPWVDLIGCMGDAEKFITLWMQQYANNRGFYAGIWFEGRFCGMINHLNVDWPNRWTVLGYWLDAAHQGHGIMTACCRAMVAHSFNAWNLNRVTIECATQNTRSRAIPERLGFQLEGIIRGAEWLHDRYVDHALYGLLQADFLAGASTIATRNSQSEANGAVRSTIPEEGRAACLLPRPTSVTPNQDRPEAALPAPACRRQSPVDPCLTGAA